MQRPTKCIVFGMDGAFPKAVERHMKQGLLPNIARLVEKGVWAQNCLCPVPTITPPNWTTIATGALPATHHITCFHLPDESGNLDRIYQAFDSRDVDATFLWETAEAAGKICLVFTYPTTWPTRLKDGYQVNGAGGGPCDFRDKDTGDWGHVTPLGEDQLFATEPYPLTKPVNLQDRSGRLVAELPFVFRHTRTQIAPVTWKAVIEGEKLRVYGDSAEKKLLAELAVGQWSDAVKWTFDTSEGQKVGRCRMKLLELEPQSKQMKLYLTGFEHIDELCYPESLAEELRDLPGLGLPDGFYQSWNLEWIDTDTLLECEEMLVQWATEAIAYMMEQRDVEMVFLHQHIMDDLNHRLRNVIEPQGDVAPEDQQRAVAAEARGYQILDESIGRLMEVAGEDTLYVLVSDHGSVGFEKMFRPADALKAAGLLVTQPREDGPGEEIVWEKTRAVPQRSCYIYVNLKGRNPTGIVEPADYEKMVEEIRNALLDYTDAETGKKPVAFAFSREDAPLVNLAGEKIGDVVFTVRSGFGGAIGGVHGVQIPTATSKDGDMRSLLVLAGPGINEGVRLDRRCGLEDIVPTICYLMDLPVPPECEGGPLYQALKDPDGPSKELNQLRKNYQRLEQALQMAQAQTHTY